MENVLKYIAALSQIVTTVTAVVTAILAYQTFLKAPTQESITTVDGIPELVIFDTGSQTTTLRATKSGLKCYLLKKEDGNESLQWTISPADAKEVIRTQNIVVQDYRAAVGKVSIGAKKNWLYSKRLHPDQDIFKDDIITLLEKISLH